VSPFSRCEAPNGIRDLIPGVVCDNVTPSLAQVQYFLGMDRCLAGIAANEAPKMVQLHETRSTESGSIGALRRVRLDPAML
jgi:hypothetical protein